MKHRLLKLLIATVVLLSFSTKIQAQKFSVVTIDSIDLVTNVNQQSVFMKFMCCTNAYRFSRIRDSLVNENKLRVDVYFKESCSAFTAVTFRDTLFPLDSSYPVVSELEAVVFLDTNSLDTINGFHFCLYDTLLPLDTAYYPSSPSKVDFEQTASQVNVYPNPARGSIHIDYPDYLEMEGINLLNIHGMIIEKYPGDVHKLSLPHISPGIYFLEFRSEKGNFAKKIILK